MYKGRKHFGPLDLAPARAKMFCEGIQKAYILNQLIEEIKEIEEIISSGELGEIESTMANIVKEQLDKQLLEFLGLKDAQGKNDKISPEKV